MKKEYRLLSNQDFSDLVKAGKRVKVDEFYIYYLKNNFNHSRFGISVSTKLGNAVIRNKTKRQVRSMVDDFIKINQKPLDVVIVVKEKYFLKDYQQNKNTLTKLLIEIEK